MERQRRERGVELAPGEVTGGAEDDERGRGRPRSALHRGDHTADGANRPIADLRAPRRRVAAKRRPARFVDRADARSRPAAGAVPSAPTSAAAPALHLPDLGEAGRRARRRRRPCCDLARRSAPDAWCVARRPRAACRSAPGALGGAWARAAYLHVPRTRLPLALAELHRATRRRRAGRPSLMLGGSDEGRAARRRLPRPVLRPVGARPSGRRASSAPASTVDGVRVRGGRASGSTCADPGADAARHRRRRDADAAVRAEPEPLLGRRAASASPRPGNRFWPAALAAGLVTRDRDPCARAPRPRRGHDRSREAGDRRRQGARPPTSTAPARRASAPRRVAAARRGVLRRPRGLAHRRRPQGRRRACSPSGFGGRPAYVMPNTSGLNAHATPATSPTTSAPPLAARLTARSPDAWRRSATSERPERRRRAAGDRLRRGASPGCRARRGSSRRTRRRPRARASR